MSEPITHGPDWLLRAGYGALVLWSVDAGGDPIAETEVIRTASVRPASYQPSDERRITGLGTSDVTGRATPVVLDVVGWPEVSRLRAWRAAGYQIVGRLVASGRGRHVIWDEPVPVLLTPFSDGRASLEGDRLTMETALYAPPVTESPDLLARSAWDEDTAGVAFPVPGARVHAFTPAAYPDGGAVLGDDITIEALAYDGETVLASDTDPLPVLRLPSGTWSVRVTGAAVEADTGEMVRPVLTTYPASSLYGPGGYLIHNALSAGMDGFGAFSGYGEGTVEVDGSATITLLGRTRSVPLVAFGTPAISSLRTARGDGLLAVLAIPV